MRVKVLLQLTAEDGNAVAAQVAVFEKQTECQVHRRDRGRRQPRLLAIPNRRRLIRSGHHQDSAIAGAF